MLKRRSYLQREKGRHGNSSDEHLSLVFRVRAKLDHGEQIYVSGTTDLLGNFSTEHCVPLYTSADRYPIWKSDCVALPHGCELQYKYAVFEAGKFKRWESISCNRQVLAEYAETTNDVLDDDTGQGEIDKKGSGVSICASATSSSPSLTKSLLGAREMNASKSTPIGTTDGVIVVSYYLPVLVDYDASTGVLNVDWDNEALLSYNAHGLRVTRIGSVRFNGGVPKVDKVKMDQIQEELTQTLEEKFHCVPIFLDEKTSHTCYQVFCKGVLWPVFHNLLEVMSTENAAVQFSNKSGDEGWLAYTTVQRVFKKAIIEHFNEGDLIWIHGFHLLLLPSFLSRGFVAKIGLFLHTPFPSSEIFCTLSKREDILRSMLNADHIGFHVYEYARHFLTCCRRVLGLEWVHEGTGIHVLYGGRKVLISCMHAGMDPSALYKALEDHQVQKEADRLNCLKRGRTMFVGMDRMERLKGVPLKLLAFERFLENNEEYSKKVVLHQIGMSVRDRPQDYEQTTAEVRALVKRINERFGDPQEPVVIYDEREESQLPLKDRLGLLSVADVLLSTTVRDGLNRWPFEYVLAQSQQQGPGSEYVESRPPGIMILSDFTSCTRVLHGALHVNPWQIDQVANQILRSVTMSAEERMDRFKMDVDYVTLNTTATWCRRCLQDLKNVQKDKNHKMYVTTGLALTTRVNAMDAGFNALDIGQVVTKYRSSKKRLILLDYGGTIYSDEVQKDNIAHFAVATSVAKRDKPTDETIQILTDLAANPLNLVYVMSGKEKRDLVEALGQIPGLGLAAEAGYCYRHPKNNAWEKLVHGDDQSWKHVCRAVMEVYMERTHGVYLQESQSAMVWQFRDADPDFAHLQSKELEDQLKVLLRGNLSLEVIRGADYIEVRPSGISKGHFVSYLLHRMSDKPPDFCICIGDDASDEGCYPAVKNFKLEINRRASCFTATVGKKPSAAESYLNDISHAIDLLGMMNKKVPVRSVSSNAISQKPARSSRLESLDSIEEQQDPELASFKMDSVPAPPMNKSVSMPAFPISSTRRHSSSATLSQYMSQFPSELTPYEDDDDEEQIWF